MTKKQVVTLLTEIADQMSWTAELNGYNKRISSNSSSSSSSCCCCCWCCCRSSSRNSFSNSCRESCSENWKGHMDKEELNKVIKKKFEIGDMVIINCTVLVVCHRLLFSDTKTNSRRFVVYIRDHRWGGAVLSCPEEVKIDEAEDYSHRRPDDGHASTTIQTSGGYWTPHNDSAVCRQNSNRRRRQLGEEVDKKERT